MSNENILVVDDEVRINAFIRELITNSGYRAEPALTGEEALSILRGRTPQSDQAFDLILLDIMLPGIDGYQVCRSIKSDPDIQDVSIIMLTAMGKVADRAHGLEIGADDYIPKPFDNRELLARIEAVLRVRRAEQQTRRRNRELDALNAVAEMVGRAIELPDVLNTALDQVLRALDAEGGTITLTSSTGSQAIAAKRWERLDLSAALEVSEQVARDGQPLLCTIPVDSAQRDAACVPLRSRDRVIGTLLVAGGRGADADAMDLLVAIGNQVGAAAERARLYEAAQTRSEDMAVLNDITRAITSTLDLEDVLSVAMRGIREFLHVEAGGLVLADDLSGQLVFRKMLSRDQEWDADLAIKPGEGLVGHVVEEKEPVLINDTSSYSAFAIQMDSITGLTTRSVLCAPIVVKGKAIGAIEVINRVNGPFTNDDLETLSFLAASVGVAVENARLYGELAKSKQELERSQAQLIQAEKLAATGRLAASMAHEINNPLQAIHNCLHLVIHRPLTEEKKVRYLQMAQEEVERLTAIVARTLDFYRPSKGKVAPTQINDVIESVLALAGKKLQHSRVKVQRNLALDLPPIQAVTDQITQVFLNLVINATEAMAQGGELTITTERLDDRVRASFADTGAGISPQEADKIFEPFYTTKATGTGLGLAISYGIIQRHGGQITVDSAPGQGATFAVELPIITDKL
jgi:signal transduction histidine kinase/DNA-binding response OmpR family regulator